MPHQLSVLFSHTNLELFFSRAPGGKWRRCSRAGGSRRGGWTGRISCSTPACRRGVAGGVGAHPCAYDHTAAAAAKHHACNRSSTPAEQAADKPRGCWCEESVRVRDGGCVRTQPAGDAPGCHHRHGRRHAGKWREALFSPGGAMHGTMREASAGTAQSAPTCSRIALQLASITSSTSL